MSSNTSIQNKQKVQGNQSEKIFILNFLSGGIAGIISKTATAPLERVKLILQTESNNHKITNRYNGMVDCFLRTVKEEGFQSMWRGNWANVIRYFPTQALNFSFKGITNNYLNVEEAKKNGTKTQYVLKSILGGGMAGCMTTCFVYPLDFARTMLAVDMGTHTSTERQFKGLKDCLQKVFAQGGIRGIYRGFNSCLFGIFIYRGLYFGIYDSGKSLLMTPEREKSFILRWIFAQAVVVFSETISYPTDTIKRAMMMQSINKEVKYKSSFHCFMELKNQHGFMGLMKGGFSNVVRGMGSSLCLVLYDEIQQMSQKIY